MCSSDLAPNTENEEAIVADGNLLLLLSKGGADLPYVFQTNKLPKHQQVFYQLCDLHDSQIQELVSANDGQVGTVSKVMV